MMPTRRGALAALGALPFFSRQVDGIGISDADQQVIFQKFRQAGDVLTGKPQGSGLGLYITRRIIEHFGGSIWVESRPGAGACFSFSLPLGRAFSVVKAA